MKFKAHEYQKLAIEKILTTPKVGLFLDMGLGKTVITLTAIDRLMYWDFTISKVLVIAPLRVAEDTWSRECQKWEHLKHFKIVKVLGGKEKRETGYWLWQQSGSDIRPPPASRCKRTSQTLQSARSPAKGSVSARPSHPTGLPQRGRQINTLLSYAPVLSGRYWIKFTGYFFHFCPYYPISPLICQSFFTKFYYLFQSFNRLHSHCAAFL